MRFSACAPFVREYLEKARASSRAYAEHLAKIEALRRFQADCIAAYERGQLLARDESLSAAHRKSILRRADMWPEFAQKKAVELEELCAKTAELKAYHDECHRPYCAPGRSERRGACETKLKLFGLSRRHMRRFLDSMFYQTSRNVLPEPQLLYGIWKTASGKEYMFTRTYAIIYERDSETGIARRVLDTTMTIDFLDPDRVVVVKDGYARPSGNIRFFDSHTPERQREKEIETALAFWGITRVPLTDDRRPTIWGEVFVPGRPYPLKPERH